MTPSASGAVKPGSATPAWLAGALGDLRTLIPFVAAYVSAVKLDPVDGQTPATGEPFRHRGLTTLHRSAAGRSRA